MDRVAAVIHQCLPNGQVNLYSVISKVCLFQAAEQCSIYAVEKQTAHVIVLLISLHSNNQTIPHQPLAAIFINLCFQIKYVCNKVCNINGCSIAFI